MRKNVNILFVSVLFVIVFISEIQSQTKLKVLNQGDEAVISLHFIPGEDALVAADFYGNLLLWNSQTGKPKWKVNLNRKKGNSDHIISNIFETAVSHNGRVIAVSYDEGFVVNNRLQKGEEYNIGLFDSKSGEQLKVLKGITARALCFAFSSDDNQLASGDPDGKVYIWDTNTGNKLRTIEFVRGISALSFSADGNTLLVGQTGARSFQTSNKKDAILWDLKNNEEVKNFSVDGKYVNDALYSSDGKYIAVIGQIPDEVTLFDTKTLRFVRSLKSPEIGADKIASPFNGKLLVFYDSNYESKSGTVFFWKTEEKTKLNQVNITDASIEAISLSQNGEKLAIGTDNGKITIYKLK